MAPQLHIAPSSTEKSKRNQNVEKKNPRTEERAIGVHFDPCDSKSTQYRVIFEGSDPRDLISDLEVANRGLVWRLGWNAGFLEDEYYKRHFLCHLQPLAVFKEQRDMRWDKRMRPWVKESEAMTEARASWDKEMEGLFEKMAKFQTALCEAHFKLFENA
ncbi:MAG: hypothetical protein Q9202_006815 [Teloschistes flavicans]